MSWHDSQLPSPLFICLFLPSLPSDCLQEGLKGEPDALPSAPGHGESQPRQEGPSPGKRPGLQEEAPRVHCSARRHEGRAG